MCSRVGFRGSQIAVDIAMAENRKSKGHAYYYLSRGQLFILAIVFTIASTIFFFLGILIGQSIEERKLLQREEPIVKLPIQPKVRSPEEEMTFYDTLTGEAGQPTETEGSAQPPTTKSSGQDSTTVVTNVTPEASWSVQVTSFQSKEDATRMAADLTRQGYAAFVVSGKVKGKTWHRVRVGTYPKKDEAMTALKRLKDAHQYQNAIITRER